MSLNECKIETMKICKKKGWDKVPVENIWMYLTEEIGELASAIRRSTNQFSDRKKTSIEGEIMDVLSYLFQIADVFEIDLDAAMKKHLSVKT
jgi:NTP pyrophosphatase (non-canonical NTP hydrolase)